MEILSMLNTSKARFEQERRLVRRAGIRSTDETYDLFIAIAALPAALKRTVIALGVTALLMILSIAALTLVPRHWDSVVKVSNARGYVVMISRKKGMEQVPCPESGYACFQVLE
jgi:hypothetical protein